MSLRYKGLAVSGLALALIACGGSSGSGKGPKTAFEKSGKETRSGASVAQEAADQFEVALEQFAGYDKSQEWNKGSCKEVAKMFLSAAKKQKSLTDRLFPEALYNAGLAYQRCAMDTKAQEQFQAAVGADGGFHRARGQLVLYDYKRTGDLDRAIEQLDLVIRDAKFQNVEALTALAALQMERGSEADLDEAKKNLQRALAIDDSFMPAFNQLAVYYLEAAKEKAAKSAGRERRGRKALVVASGKKAKVSGQQLDLAALVASQGLRKNPQYAPLHNTVGLIQVELENFNGAVKSFGKARALDPGFFEAHMNYGAVNLSFRGFQEAEKAYKAALKLHPDEFDAHLGLALAIRGQINPGNRKELLKKSEEHLQKARQLEPDRPETYYNEAILTQEYKAKGEEQETIPALRKAAELYQEFIGRAGGDEVFAEAVERAKDRTQDIEDTIKFIEEGAEARAEAERAAKEAAAQKAAEKAVKKAEKKAEKKDEKKDEKDKKK